MERYIDVLHGTAATNAQATEVSRAAVKAVNVDRDSMSSLSGLTSAYEVGTVTLLRSKIRSADTQRTAPVPYVNFYVSLCVNVQNYLPRPPIVIP